MNKENDSPKVFDFKVCPMCLSDRRLAYEVLQEEVKKGKFPAKSNAYLYSHQSIIAQGTNWLSAPVIISYFDMCVDCGAVYCVHAEVRKAVQGVNNVPNNLIGGGENN